MVKGKGWRGIRAYEHQKMNVGDGSSEVIKIHLTFTVHGRLSDGVLELGVCTLAEEAGTRIFIGQHYVHLLISGWSQSHVSGLSGEGVGSMRTS